MEVSQWILCGFHFLLFPVVLGMLVRFADTPSVSDGIDFPNEKRVSDAFEHTVKSAERDNWHIHSYVKEQYLNYMKTYILHQDMESRYSPSNGDETLQSFLAIMTLLISGLRFLIKLPCSTLLKIVFGSVAIAVFCFLSFLADWTIFPHYKSIEHEERKEFKLTFPWRDITEDAAEIYFETLYYKYVPVLERQIHAMENHKARSTIIRCVLFLLLLASAYIFLHH